MFSHVWFPFRLFTGFSNTTHNWAIAKSKSENVWGIFEILQSPHRVAHLTLQTLKQKWVISLGTTEECSKKERDILQIRPSWWGWLPACLHSAHNCFCIRVDENVRSVDWHIHCWTGLLTSVHSCKGIKWIETLYQRLSIKKIKKKPNLKSAHQTF